MSHDSALKKKEVGIGVNVDKLPGDTAELKIHERDSVCKEQPNRYSTV